MELLVSPSAAAAAKPASAVTHTVKRGLAAAMPSNAPGSVATRLADEYARRTGHLNFAVLRTRTALRQTQSVLDETAKSLQRTACVLGLVSA
jgi:hypothetical protein